MKLHIDRESFDNLITVTAEYIGVPYSAVKRDYYIVKLLQNLQNSEYADMCVFKGGTSSQQMLSWFYQPFFWGY